jgi:aryl-alcohol dehydrogenase-like predicted oxidoreductase
MQSHNFESNRKIVEKVEEIAAAKNATASQIALAWVLAKGEDVIPIPGTKREKYLIENLDALKIELRKDEISELDKLYALVKGNRYNEYSMGTTLQ